MVCHSFSRRPPSGPFGTHTKFERVAVGELLISQLTPAQKAGLRQRMLASFAVRELYCMRKASALALLVLCLGGFHSAWSQEVTAAVIGNVVDPTGASIIGATVTAKD